MTDLKSIVARHLNSGAAWGQVTLCESSYMRGVKACFNMTSCVFLSEAKESIKFIKSSRHEVVGGEAESTYLPYLSCSNRKPGRTDSLRTLVLIRVSIAKAWRGQKKDNKN